MAVKIRLQRRGRKGAPFYHIVAADSRAPRDGKFIEKLGTYNPMPNNFIIDVELEKALHWLEKGAQPTHTAKSILSKAGVYLKKHLLGGVKKGAFDAQEAAHRFELWKKEKEEKNLDKSKFTPSPKKEVPKKTENKPSKELKSKEEASKENISKAKEEEVSKEEEKSS